MASNRAFERDAVYIIGVGSTIYGRLMDYSISDIARGAFASCIKDSGLDVGDIGAVFFGNSTQGHFDQQHMIRGPIVARRLGLHDIPVSSVENACATGATAFFNAVNCIKAGEAHIALALGAEKMIHSDKGLMFSAFDSAMELGQEGANIRTLSAGLLGGSLAAKSGEKSRSLFMDVYACLARQHMQTYGTTKEHLAIISSKNHGYSQANPYAQFRNPFTVEEVLSAREIVEPFTLPMCAPISDGGTAIVVASGAELNKRGFSKNLAVRVRSSALGTGSPRSIGDWDAHVVRKVALRAYESAGVGPEDIDVAEVHDATAFGELLQYENLGFCARGDGGAFAMSGATFTTGKVPVNVSGGLQSKGHPIGATGLGQIFELVHQLRETAPGVQVSSPQMALAENGGGFVDTEEAIASVIILSNS